jgi:ubiquinone/menaquinone biosynthesis C-methylase UbiE
MISRDPNEARSLLVATSGENQKTYYEAEDRILGDPTHLGYIMPHLAPGQSVLNLGCGSMKLFPPGDELYVGIDALFEPLYGRKKENAEDLSVRAIGEKLPIRDETFDVIMSRVAIMYMDIPAFTAEAYRVLKPDGTLWLTGHKFTHVLLHLSRSIRKGNVKDVIFRSYVILNGLLFHVFGGMVRFPFNRRRIESFQTRRGVRRELTRRRFTDIQFFVDRPKPRGFLRTLRRARRLMASARLRGAFGQLMEWQHFLIIARKPLDT